MQERPGGISIEQLCFESADQRLMRLSCETQFRGPGSNESFGSKSDVAVACVEASIFTNVDRSCLCLTIRAFGLKDRSHSFKCLGSSSGPIRTTL